MSDAEDRVNDPDYVSGEQDYSIVNMQELDPGTSADVGVDVRSVPSLTEELGQERYRKRLKCRSILKPIKDRRTSLIWTKFTIVNKKEQIASCNICDQRLSIKSTSSNLKKHLERKHGFSIQLGVLNNKKPKYITPTPRPKVSELAGVSDKGITVKVVGENGEEEHFQLLGEQYLSEEVVHGEVQEHGYSAVVHESEADTERLKFGEVRSQNEAHSSQSRREPYAPPRSTFLMDDKTKRQRIQELQMDCLENKKYNMQLEALLMEQQLNLPRSIFTQPLRFTDTRSRSTQTDVGGSETKVFYISDKRGGQPIQHLFSMADVDDF